MDALLNNSDAVVAGFTATLTLAVIAGVLAFIWGVLLAGFRVSPVGPLRTFGKAYVELVRNTPLTLLFLFLLVGTTPLLGITIPLTTFFGESEFLGANANGLSMAILAMTLYTATFVCEAVRSGINSVGIGQAEASRSVGMTFIQTLTLIVLPQAFRTVVPPLINVFVAHVKNTSVAAGFTFAELVAISQRTTNTNPADGVGIFVGIGLLYLAINVPLGFASEQLERKWAIVR